MKLKSGEDALLRQVVGNRMPSLMPIVDLIGHEPLTVEERESLRGVLADELCAVGLGAGDEPNEKGLAIDGLIGRLSHF